MSILLKDFRCVFSGRCRGFGYGGAGGDGLVVKPQSDVVIHTFHRPGAAPPFPTSGPSGRKKGVGGPLLRSRPRVRVT